MGWLDLLRPESKEAEASASALDAARDKRPDDGAISGLVQILIDTGLDGRGPIRGSQYATDRALRHSSDPDEAIERIVRSHIVRAAFFGFVTGVGGFVTLPIALPVNVAEFYVQATRMVGAIATVRGYDVQQQEVRTAVLLTLVGSRADQVLSRAGVGGAGNALSRLALRPLPPAALMMVNKAVGFRLVRGVMERFLSRLGKGIPVFGGAFGAMIDTWMMRRIAEQAMLEFPRREAKQVAPLGEAGGDMTNGS
jgi:hypothetical protein